jgi:hypothetical protein
MWHWLVWFFGGLVALYAVAALAGIDLTGLVT